jgi:hypothetical protein
MLLVAIPFVPFQSFGGFVAVTGPFVTSSKRGIRRTWKLNRRRANPEGFFDCVLEIGTCEEWFQTSGKQVYSHGRAIICLVKTWCKGRKYDGRTEHNRL